jgi:hypothetical protein
MNKWALPLGALFIFMATACNNANVQITGGSGNPGTSTPPTTFTNSFSINNGQQTRSNSTYVLKARVSAFQSSTLSQGNYVLKNGVVR